MKNLLIASSVLAMTAGVASAQDRGVSFGGDLSFGIAINGTANGGTGSGADTVLANNQYHVYSTINLIATVEGTSDTGLSFGTTIDIQSGPSYTLGDDDGFEDNGGTEWSSPTIFVTGSWGTMSFSSNNIDFYDDNAFNGGGGNTINNGSSNTDNFKSISNTGDFKYEGTWGGFFTGLVVDIETGDASGQVGYNLYGVDILADYSMDSRPSNPTGALWNLNLGYNWQTFNFALGADNDNSDHDYNTDYFFTVGTTFAGIDGFVTYNMPAEGGAKEDPEWDIGASYAGGPVTLTAEANNVGSANSLPGKNGGTLNGLQWTVTGEYALASGVVVQAGVNYTGDAMLGASFSF
jgi:hypothetical protein